MTTTNSEKRYPRRNGREMSTKEKRLFDRIEERYRQYLKTDGINRADSLPYNLAALAIWEMQDYVPK